MYKNQWPIRNLCNSIYERSNSLYFSEDKTRQKHSIKMTINVPLLKFINWFLKLHPTLILKTDKFNSSYIRKYYRIIRYTCFHLLKQKGWTITGKLWNIIKQKTDAAQMNLILSTSSEQQFSDALLSLIFTRVVVYCIINLLLYNW